jgi:UDP-N-acetyl-D-mannosaminuronic acid dehydrogenase
MSSPLRMKPEDVDTSEKRSKYTVASIGCPQAGVLCSCLFADAGYKVICADTDQIVVNLLAKGKTSFAQHETEAKLKYYAKIGRITTTNDIKMAVSQSNIIVVNTPIEVDQKRKPNYSNLEKTWKLVGTSVHQDSLIIVTSIVGTGVIEGMMRETLENASGFKIGTDLGLAYSPIRTFQGQTLEIGLNYGQIVAAPDKTSLNAASALLETVTKNDLRRTLSVKAAEIAVLFEAEQRDVNNALANELAVFCEKAGADYLEAERLLRTNAPASPSPVPSEADTEDAVYLLLEDAENFNAKLRTVAVAREINKEMARHIANLTREALRNCGKTLRRARICLLGISQTPNVKSPTKKLAKELAKILEARGAKISVYDPYFSNEATETRRYLKKSVTEALEGADCIVLVTSHDQFKRLSPKKLKVMMKMPAAIVDLEGVFEPDKIEKEGLAYRGLGRGAWPR